MQYGGVVVSTVHCPTSAIQPTTHNPQCSLQPSVQHSPDRKRPLSKPAFVVAAFALSSVVL